jgi:hypothetical protein
MNSEGRDALLRIMTQTFCTGTRKLGTEIKHARIIVSSVPSPNDSLFLGVVVAVKGPRIHLALTQVLVELS